ncbi:RidA family protein [Breoghania sp. L-A4]|uniref:RidA family protein n=1 Tax=Breoghania sp. L-A4 TaxID=2304600 RepID=UPI000E358366|nr:RidA family protein [Breoghania sp. L-A4]AXS40883.1 RidA family protein [Breoghania sp. L-A4]
MAGTIDARLQALNITLPSPAAPAANYVPYVISGKHLFVSGQLPMGPDGIQFKGICGDTLDAADGQRAARLCAINILAQARAATGDLDKIARLVKLGGFVASTPDFTEQPAVINGASDLMAEVLGEKGQHARAAVGVAALPFGVAVEIEAIFELA